MELTTHVCACPSVPVELGDPILHVTHGQQSGCANDDARVAISNQTVNGFSGQEKIATDTGVSGFTIDAGRDSDTRNIGEPPTATVERTRSKFSAATMIASPSLKAAPTLLAMVAAETIP